MARKRRRKRYLYPIVTYSKEYRNLLRAVLNIVRHEVSEKIGHEMTIAEAILIYISATFKYFKEMNTLPQGEMFSDLLKKGGE